jgi:hypothetical protein
MRGAKQRRPPSIVGAGVAILVYLRKRKGKLAYMKVICSCCGEYAVEQAWAIVPKYGNRYRLRIQHGPGCSATSPTS